MNQPLIAGFLLMCFGSTSGSAMYIAAQITQLTQFQKDATRRLEKLETWKENKDQRDAEIVKRVSVLEVRP